LLNMSELLSYLQNNEPQFRTFVSLPISPSLFPSACPALFWFKGQSMVLIEGYIGTA
jgi:hypothetical protein